jgi:hypothetical protein
MTKKLLVELKGTTPLLMHSAAAMEAQKPKTNPSKVYDAEKDAEAAAYRNEDGYLYVPARCIKAAIIGASSWYKVGKSAMKPIVASCTRIEPEQVILIDDNGRKLKDYTIDKRSVVVKDSRIIRARPRLDKWKLKFEIVYNEEILPDPEVLKKIIGEAGVRFGLLDNRPQTYGENGTFEIVTWQEL